MQLAFFHGPGNGITRAIRTLTRGPYSHVELVFSDGACFSASGRRTPAVQFERKNLSTGWDLYDFPASSEQERIMREYAETLQGASFDWRGLFAIAIPPLGSKPGAWLCTCLIVVVSQRAGLLMGIPVRISPNQFYRLLIQP